MLLLSNPRLISIGSTETQMTMIITLALLFSSHYLLPASPAEIPAIFVDAREANAGGLQTYIIHVQQPGNTTVLLRDADRETWHRSFLPNATLDTGEPRLIYSYRDVISGFAARLTADEVRMVQSMDGFVHAWLDQQLPLLTTHTPEFLGLSQRYGAWYDNNYGQGAIIGVLDTGVLATHPSFSSAGMPQPPANWRGNCDLRVSKCNNKIIGAMAFLAGRPTLVDDDDDGHGTHVAGIASANFVDNANVLGTANGTAAGVAPKAHLSIYKVCSSSGCADIDILAGIDQAIHDRVDVISISAGLRSRPFYEDSVAIGTFAAVRKGILACAAAGNDGPNGSTVANDAPWILTVGASSTDRRIRATVRLGDGAELDGESAYQPTSFNSSLQLPMVFPGHDGRGGEGCRNGSFAGVDIKGKIVICSTGYNVSNIEKGQFVRQAGGAAMILMNQYEQGFTTLSEAHVLPAAHVSYSNALKIVSYHNSSSTNCSSKATIVYNGTQLGARPSPSIAAFSSRGPSPSNGGILKPDLVAPGLNILAAWPTGSSSPSTFSFMSGTSPATAHVAGAAAMITATNPHWSPAEVKSAIMTTADVLDESGNSIADEFDGNAANLFAMGSGHVNPSKAGNPGLVYDIHLHDYKRYLCSLGYTDEQVTAIYQHRVKCSKVHEIEAEQLNYPSISVSLGSKSRKIVKRTVKNVGEGESVYFLEIKEPTGVTVEVSPSRLEFTKLHEKKRFHVEFRANGTDLKRGEVSEGQLSWVSRRHAVRSAISVSFV